MRERKHHEECKDPSDPYHLEPGRRCPRPRKTYYVSVRGEVFDRLKTESAKRQAPISQVLTEMIAAVTGG